MGLVKTSITIPEDLYRGAKKVSNNFSAVTAEALKEYLKRQKIRKAVASFASWEKRSQKSVDMVNEMRRKEGQNYADRTHRH
jgi:post-segregation antitoxin (ccd killing protein)